MPIERLYLEPRGSFLTAVLTAIAVCVGAPAPARASTVDVECAGSFSRSFSPAVTATSQTVSLTETDDYNSCVVGPTGSSGASVNVALACLPLNLQGALGNETITWNDATGGTSTISWSATTIVAQTVVFTGTVTDGRYAGDSATKVTSGITYFASIAECLLLGTPVSSATGLIDSLLLTQ